MKFILSIAITLVFVGTLIGQENSIRNEITIKVGFSRTAIKDARISALTQKTWSPKYGMSYRKANAKRISQLDFEFTNVNSKNGTLLNLSSIIPKVNYSYKRKVDNGLWVGGFIDHITLLNFPKTRTSLFNNNTISYLMTASIGPSISYDKSDLFGVDKLNFRTDAQAPLLSYVIQPEFGHPYPRKYLEQDTFSPTRDGLAGPLLKSGRLVTINKFRSLNISFSFQYLVSDKIGFSLNLNSQLLYANTTNKALSLNNQDILFGTTYFH